MARIAFIACNKNAGRYAQDPSFLYRCMNLSHGVQLLGHQVWTGHISSLPWRQHWDLVVFHRPRASLRFKLLVMWLRKRGTRVLADVDDLIMDPSLAMHSPGVRNGLVALAVTQKQFVNHYAALQCVDGIAVSTQPLMHEVKRLLPDAEIMVAPNGVYHSWWDLPVPERERGAKLITYMPGTRSHDRDFALLTPVVERVLRRHPQVRLQITGPLDFSVDARSGQVVHREKLPFAQYHEIFGGASINLAPLESSPFTRCKSALKIIEAAWWNMPTVCSDFPDATRFDGVGALRASSAKAFEDHLEHLLGDIDAFETLAHGLRERVRPLVDIRSLSAEWLEFALPRGCE